MAALDSHAMEEFPARFFRIPEVARVAMNFEREFFRTAREFLRCRLALIPVAREAEGAMLGMWDWEGEMRLVCEEARKARTPPGGAGGAGRPPHCPEGISATPPALTNALRCISVRLWMPR